MEAIIWEIRSYGLISIRKISLLKWNVQDVERLNVRWILDNSALQSPAIQHKPYNDRARRNLQHIRFRTHITRCTGSTNYKQPNAWVLKKEAEPWDLFCQTRVQSFCLPLPVTDWLLLSAIDDVTLAVEDSNLLMLVLKIALRIGWWQLTAWQQLARFCTTWQQLLNVFPHFQSVLSKLWL